ncbi:conjugal transfer protein MobC [Foetidibacter luteolus]|uniref:conjugal transfer protein MobC n=1 Tax=Foetidibacter luteolus TaxID=2608880 RepID=UPI001F3639DD|nr:conjugal transfer protein MobC [Foetidibacter luteolus]
MAMHTGENEQGLRKIIDMIRMISIVVLLLHFYFYCYYAFEQWKLTTDLTDKILQNIIRSGLFSNFHKSKLIALGLLLLSLIGIKGRKSDKLNYRTGLAYFITGLLLYFISGLVLLLSDVPSDLVAILYFIITGVGFILILTGGAVLSRIIRNRMKNDMFNKLGQTFQQEERKLTNPYSLNLPAVYNLKGQLRKSWISFVNPRRSILVLGSPGSGKSYFLIENFIRQLADKGMSLFVFDYKYPELTTLTYNHFLKNYDKYPVGTRFYNVNFKDASSSNRCNPIDPRTMDSMTDAVEASKTLLYSINKTWLGKQGDFFPESAINILAAAIWFLFKYREGEFCTLPHTIELIHTPYTKLFTIFRAEPELETLLDPFVTSFLDNNIETLDSQMASIKIPLGRLSSPEFYYVLSGNDFTLDINNPLAPKIFCLGSNAKQANALAPVISLYVDRLNKIINQPGKHPCALVIDEASTLRATSILETIATGRSNDIIVILALQDYSQLKRVYSREEAETIMNIAGNIISGQVAGETAKMLSERFGKTMQDRESLSINSSDTSLSKSQQLETVIPPSTISSLSSGEFVGLVADDPLQKIDLKMFHSSVVNDHAAITKEKKNYLPLPVWGAETSDPIRENFRQVKTDVDDIVEAEMERIMNTPALGHLIVKSK